MCPANPFSSPATKTNLQQATHQHALLCIIKKMLLWNECSQAAQSGFFLKPILFTN
jgi:hypothetical protein